MDITTATTGSSSLETIDGDNVFTALSDSTRRRLLGILYDRAPDSLTRRDLATTLVSEHPENPNDAQTAGAVEQMRIELHHVHLPHLEAVGLVDYSTDNGTLNITDHPAFEDAGIVKVISGAASADTDSLDTLFEMLANPRRRTILDALSHQLGPIHTETLAREVGAKEQGTAEAALSPEGVHDILVSLHHAHLPALASAGLIQHDSNNRTVKYSGHAELRTPWMHSVFEPDFQASFIDKSESEGMGTIQGREEIVSFGQSLFDRAEEELFCMITDTDLVGAGCLTRIKQAADRGVDVYLGTRDAAVREYVQENAPEIVLWEPERNWLNLPVAGNNVGRLVLVDRTVVMLGTLREETDDGIRNEQAIIGEGANNALVVLVGQLLCPSVDQNNQDLEGIKAQLPF